MPKPKTHIQRLFDCINGGDDVDAAAMAQEITTDLLEALQDTKRQLEMAVARLPLNLLWAALPEQISVCAKVIAKAEGRA